MFFVFFLLHLLFVQSYNWCPFDPQAVTSFTRGYLPCVLPSPNPTPNQDPMWSNILKLQSPFDSQTYYSFRNLDTQSPVTVEFDGYNNCEIPGGYITTFKQSWTIQPQQCMTFFWNSECSYPKDSDYGLVTISTSSYNGSPSVLISQVQGPNQC